MPTRVKLEVERYLTCGDPRFGFVEVSCASSSTKVAPAPKPKRPRLDWATLHQRTFGTDVLRCPCGGRRTIRSLHSTRKQAEARLTQLGVPLPSRVLPPATAPPQLLLAM